MLSICAAFVAVAAVKQTMDMQHATHSFFIADCVLMGTEPYQMAQILAASDTHVADWGYICSHALLPKRGNRSQDLHFES